MKRFNNNSGFSLVETILALVMGAVVVGLTSQMLGGNIDSYAYIANRKAALGDARHAMNQVSDELLHLETADISAIQPTSIQFVDQSGTATNFNLGVNGSGLGLFRGPDLLVDNISEFSLNYYDAAGNKLAAEPAQIPNVRRIQVSIKTAEVSDEGEISLSTVVTPRVFVGYSNYQ